MKKIKYLVIVLVFIFWLVLFGTVISNASGDLYLNSLHFDVQINTDGSMTVIENWDINIEETNTLFKTFKADSSKYSKITNTTITDTTNGNRYKQINNEMYHVTKDCFYSLINSKGEHEIAWGVGLDNSIATKKYKIQYTVQDVMTKYNDCAELYWQFVGEDFEISAKNITGTITLPSNVESKSDIKVWGHTQDLNGEIYATTLNKVEFEVNKFKSGRYVEIRVAIPSKLINSSGRTYNKNNLQNIIDEETQWAEQANKKREQEKLIKTIMSIIVFIIVIVINIVFVIKTIKKIKKLKSLKKLTVSKQLKYYREIPRKDATPAEALSLLKKITGGFEFSSDIGKVFSATLLDLNLKKFIEFEMVKDEKDRESIIIKLIENQTDISGLKDDEKEILNFVIKAVSGKQYITVKKLEKYIKTHQSKVVSLKSGIDTNKKKQLLSLGMIDKKEISEKEKYSLGILGYIFVLVFSFILGVIFLISSSSSFIYIGIGLLFVLCIANVVINSIILSRINVFTQKGIDEIEMWKGLKRYMEDFSMLDKRNVPEIVIWEKYLVYATAFGIADKVLKQLKIVYPNLEEITSINNSYTYMNLMIHANFASSFSNSISSAMSSAYTSATYSSGSGGGGGFSGGGGFGRRWRPVAEEDR